MTYMWVRFFDDDAFWRMISLCYLLATFFLYWPLLMLVSFDVQVLKSDVDDPVATTDL